MACLVYLPIVAFSQAPGYLGKKAAAYLSFSNFVALTGDQKTNLNAVWISLLAPYLLPLAVAHVLTPDYDMLYYAILFDIRSGRRSFIKMDFFDKRDSKTILNAHIYDVFHQIKSRSK